MRRSTPLLALALALLAWPTSPARAQDAKQAATEASRQAALAYDAGRCAQVLGIFEALPAASVTKLDGVSHYRWGYCVASLGKGSPLEHYRECARKLAVEAAAEGSPVDAHFYRVNALLNLQESPRAREAAALAVERWKAGTLTVPEEDGRAWFRLGKLHRDAGQAKDAAEPFARALALHESGKSPLNEAYLQRIADGGRAAGDDKLALRALGAMQKLRPADPSTALREARTLIAGGDLESAKALMQKARAGTGDTSMLAQYSYYAILRLQELEGWDLLPAEALADGTPIVDADLRLELRNAAAAAFESFKGPHVEEPRKKKKNKTRLVAAPAVREEMRITQSVFCGLLREAMLRGSPLREWAIEGGYAPLIHHPWNKLYRQQLKKRLAEAEAGKGAGAEDDGGAR